MSAILRAFGWLIEKLNRYPITSSLAGFAMFAAQAWVSARHGAWWMVPVFTTHVVCASSQLGILWTALRDRLAARYELVNLSRIEFAKGAER